MTPSLSEDNERVLVRLAAFGAATSQSLYSALSFPCAERVFRRRLQRLRNRGLIENVRLDSRRRAYILTAAGRRASPQVSKMLRAGRHAPPQDLLPLAWWRAEVVRLFDNDGWTVGSSPRHLLVVRRWLLDAMRAHPELARDRLLQTSLSNMEASPSIRPPMTFTCKACGFVSEKPPPCDGCGARDVRPGLAAQVSRCSSCAYRGEDPHHAVHKTGPFTDRRQVILDDACTGTLRPHPDYTPYTIAYLKDAAGVVQRLALIVVDQPFRSVSRQLKELPLFFSYKQRPIELFFLPDDRSTDSELGPSPSPRRRSLAKLLRPTRDGFRLHKTTSESDLAPLLLPTDALISPPPGIARSSLLAAQVAEALSTKPRLPPVPPRMKRRSQGLFALSPDLLKGLQRLTANKPAWSVAQAASFLLATPEP